MPARARMNQRDPRTKGSGPMTHLKGAVWTERLLLVLILASLGGTLNLVLAVHRRVNAISSARKAETIAQPEPPVIPPAPKIANSPQAAAVPPPRRRNRTRSAGSPAESGRRPHGEDPGADGWGDRPGT